MAFSQRLPSVPTEVSFGGETLFFNAQGQKRLQEEILNLYADRAALRTAIDQMRHVESLVRPMLEERSIPADIRYLCLPMKTSNGAYWDLDTRKASRLKLRVDNTVDERLNIASSSEAVLSELAAWHTTYPTWNWIRVLLNYAAGHRPNDPAEIIESGGARLPTDQLQLPADMPTVVWIALARKVVFEYETQLAAPAPTSFLLYDYRQGRNKSLAAIARELGIDQDRFTPFNEWLRVRVIPNDKVYPVLIRLTPSELLTVKGRMNSTVKLGQPAQWGLRRDIGFPVLRKIPGLPFNDPIVRTSVQFYEINDRKGVQAQSCDNVITLAYYGRLSVKSFMNINDMTDRDLVRPGEIYYLEPKARKATIPFHVVQVGQTLREVSTIYGIRMKYLLRYNRLETAQRLVPGRILWLREKRPDNVPPEYQVLPEPVPDPEPAVADQKLTPQQQEPVASSTATAPPTQPFPATTDSTKEASRAGSVGIAKPPGGSEPTGATKTPPSQTQPLLLQTLYYTVRKGDTHSALTQRFNISLTDLITWNNLSYRKPLVIGQQLIVRKELPPATAKTNTSPLSTTPVVSQPVTTTEAPVSRPASRPVRPRPQPIASQVRMTTPRPASTSYYHIVQPGQTVYRIALINKVTVEDVMRWNNLANYTIEVGQKILIKK